MKRRSLDPETPVESAERSLCEALLSLKNVREMGAFLGDLCTPAELEVLVDRWRVVPFLLEEVSYREIHERTAVSITTIGRVARYLNQGNGGYLAAAARAVQKKIAGCEKVMSMKPRDRLRIAMQKSGRLTEPALDLLNRCGLSFRQSRDKLFCFGEGEPVDLLLVRDDDIPGLIAQGVCDLGIVGRNVLGEFQLTAGADAAPIGELRPLGFGRCRLSIAVPQELDYQSPQQLQGQRIATSYPGLLGAWLRRHQVDAGVVTLAGSVEIAPRLGTADAICDLVQSGGTLVANQLRETEVLLESEAVLAGPLAAPADERGDMLELLLKRLDGVIQVRESRLLLLQTSRVTLDAVTRLLPGGPQPTLLAVAGQPDQLMLQALCAGEVSWRQLEEIKQAGAREMFVLPVEKMLA